MAATDNAVLATVLQFCHAYGRTPEAVVYGYAKLLRMDEIPLRSILSEQDRKELDEVRKLMDENKLDMDLIKSGFILLIPMIRLQTEETNLYQQFEAFLERDVQKINSVEVVKKALQTMVLPVKDIFTTGHSMDDVFAYLKELKIKAKTFDEQKNGASEDADDDLRKQEKENNKGDAVLKEKAENGEHLREKTEKECALKEEQSTRKEAENQKTPVSEMEEKKTFTMLAEKYRNLHRSLLDVVKGQDQAVSKFVQGCFQGEVLQQKEKGKQPRTYFFFFGPPGTGKTLLAETAAEHMGVPVKKYNMSEYASQNSPDALIGTSQIYSNSKEGSLTRFVRQNPECVLIFDEIEKAHINVIRLFLQILGSGSLHSVSKEEDISFRDTIIIFTSNVGKELYADRSVSLSTLPEKVIVNAVQSEINEYGNPALPAEICSRLAAGNMIMFNHLSMRYLAEMADDNFRRISIDMEEVYGVPITYSNKLPLLFLYNRGSGIDARVATGQSGSFLKKEIYELTRQLDNNKAADGVSSIHFDIEWDGMDEELKRLFVNDGKAEVLFLVDKEMADVLCFDTEKYTVYWAASIEEARKHLKKDITAVFINPFLGKRAENSHILSIADYNTDGVIFFHELAEKQTGISVYLLEVDQEFSEVDRRTFLQEGASGTIVLKKDYIEAFMRQFEQIMEELYMERESQTFSQRGWVIDCKSKQDVSSQKGTAKVLFYDLKKRMAIDMESRGAVLSEAQRPDVKFSDIVGAQKAKEELQYFIRYLTNPKQFMAAGGRPPKGILLYGPPGTGKTMLAKAMAGESDVAFLQTSASEFKNKFIGESEANIRKIFKRAKQYAPAIIFIDEIDAIGKQRTGTETAAHTDSMLNALLTEMDGFSSNSQKPIFVLAATNYGAGREGEGISSLDSALLRRFDNKIYVDLPKQNERKKYMSLLVQKRNITGVSEQILENIAERTTGQSLAILQNIFDLAIRNAARESHAVTDHDLLNALEEYIYGEKREHTPEYYRSVAFHEETSEGIYSLEMWKIFQAIQNRIC